MEEKAKEVKDWARERFARKDDVLPRLKALEKQREKDVEQTLQFMRAQSMNSIYIGNLGEDDKDKGDAEPDGPSTRPTMGKGAGTGTGGRRDRVHPST